MPVEISNIEEFIRLSEKAEHCLMKRTKNLTKLKLRTSRRLYTFKVDSKKAEELLKKLKCETKEI